jgi:hypothetical protein
VPGPAGAPYCTPAQVAQVVQPAVLALATDAQQTQACINATAEADSYLANRYAMPLLAWGADLVLYTSYLAAYQLVRLLIGVAPQAGSDDVYDTMRRLAIGGKRNEENAPRQEGWFEKVQRQAIVPDVTPSAAVGADPGHDAPQISSLPMRNWQTGNRVGGF